MRPLALALVVLAAACAERQDHRSSAEAACAAQAERLVLDRNRGRNLMIDSSMSGPATLMEETSMSAEFARQSEFRERDRLTRECLQRIEAQNRPAAGPAAAAPAPAPAALPASAQPPMTGTGQPASSEFRRGTALPPPPASGAPLPAPAPAQPPVRGW
ncbi:hypothetical protein [Elioraea rosea]|uniref:hypothetical protein n=1 Tax=Elioraea rosea TaxID=2492390 RepID=UPI001185B493|nr:hypothetical protein [Elioraea rosea]